MKAMVAAVLALLLGLGVLALLPSIWRGTSPFLESDGSAGLRWFWGERIGRGLVRGIAMAGLAFVAVGVSLTSLALNGGDDLGPVGRAAGWAALGALGLMMLIVLFNRPKLLVPPSLRAERGAVFRTPRRADQGRT